MSTTPDHIWPTGFARDIPGALGFPSRIDVCYHLPQAPFGYYQFGADYVDNRDKMLVILNRSVARSMERDGHKADSVIWGRLPLYGQGGFHF